MLNKGYLIIIFSFFTIGSTAAQYVWYENSTNTNHITLESASKGTFTTDEINPDTSGVNSNTTVSKFVRDGQENPSIRFNLEDPITDFSSYTISLKAHTSIPTAELNTTNKRIRLYLRNSSVGNSSNMFLQLKFTEGETWETFSFDFDGITIPADVALAGGYDQITIHFASGDNGGLTSTYHIDAISGSSDQSPCQTSNQSTRHAEFLSSSWGVRFNLSGGIRLDNTSHDDWLGGVQEIVDNLPAVGHVITNATHPAHGYYYTLRDNPYVDIANEIHPAMVPTLENEQIILDIIDVIKSSGKKVILYLNGGGPGHLQGNSAEELEIKAAWEAYYNLNFAGDEALAWRTLVKGYVERFKGLADGYWLDNLSNLPGGDLGAFVETIKGVDPNLAIATNLNKSYLKDENEVNILVDSDGTNDENPTDYKVFFLEANDPYMDFTAGHPTPLGQGAPPNSWAYEEFNFPLIVENPWDTYDCSKETLKHYFCPIREKWSVARVDLIFEVEQAYRFVRTFTDAGAAITWSTTITDGFITDDEMAIMQEINARMLQSPKPDPEPYVRPEGAHLVGEESLPVDLVSFEANAKDNHILLEWQTASEENNLGFEVQRSKDAIAWDVLGFVAGKGTASVLNTYDFTDRLPSHGSNYYRLKQLDYDGKFEFSKTVSVDFNRLNEGDGIVVFPNPTKDQLTIIKGEGAATIYNVLGQAVKRLRGNDPQVTIQLTDLSYGQYYIKVLQKNGKVVTKQFMKVN